MNDLEKKIETLRELIKKDKEHQIQEQRYGPPGWVCPKCGRVYSPYHDRCDYCCGAQLRQVTCMLGLNGKEIAEDFYERHKRLL